VPPRRATKAVIAENRRLIARPSFGGLPPEVPPFARRVSVGVPKMLPGIITDEAPRTSHSG
jgi:hypothetical protein